MQDKGMKGEGETYSGHKIPHTTNKWPSYNNSLLSLQWCELGNKTSVPQLSPLGAIFSDGLEKWEKLFSCDGSWKVVLPEDLFTSSSEGGDFPGVGLNDFLKLKNE